jgi:hypothetical protein
MFWGPKQRSEWLLRAQECRDALLGVSYRGWKLWETEQQRSAKTTRQSTTFYVCNWTETISIFQRSNCQTKAEAPQEKKTPCPPPLEYGILALERNVLRAASHSLYSIFSCSHTFNYPQRHLIQLWTLLLGIQFTPGKANYLHINMTTRGGNKVCLSTRLARILFHPFPPPITIAWATLWQCRRTCVASCCERVLKKHPTRLNAERNMFSCATFDGEKHLLPRRCAEWIVPRYSCDWADPEDHRSVLEEAERVAHIETAIYEGHGKSRKCDGD